MNIGILTSVETRHLYFARTLCDQFDVRAVAYEKTGYSPAKLDLLGMKPKEARILTEHFAERTRQEEIFFSHKSVQIEESDTRRVCHIQPGQLNSPATLDFLLSAQVDTLIIYGTNLIKEPLLSRFSGRMVNMHLGLSPYYRGTATNFYPLLNEEPQYVGATIHLINAGIDSGPILAHARPEITEDDLPHTIGCKAIQAGIDKLIEVIPQWDQGLRKPISQWKVPNARLYLRKDYQPQHTVELYEKLEAGLMTNYVKQAGEVANQIRLID